MLRTNVYDWDKWNGKWKLIGYWFRDPTCGHWHYHDIEFWEQVKARERFASRGFTMHAFNRPVQASQADVVRKK